MSLLRVIRRAKSEVAHQSQSPKRKSGLSRVEDKVTQDEKANVSYTKDEAAQKRNLYGEKLHMSHIEEKVESHRRGSRTGRQLRKRRGCPKVY